MRNTTLRGLVLLPLLILLAAAVFLGDLRRGEDLLIQRKYAEAAEAIAAVLDDLPVELRARGTFLLGQSRLLAGDREGAIEAFRRVQEDFQGSPEVAQSRFGEARALERSGDLRAAAVIYRDEVEKLVGLERKQEVAATYLGLAEKALAKDPPQHVRAVSFLDLALDLGLPAERARSVRLRAAESLLAAGRYADAVKRLDALKDQLSVAEGKPRAMLALGQGLRQTGAPARCRTVLRDLRALVPDAPEAADAAYEIALSYGVPTPNTPMLDRATTALRELQDKHPSHDKAKVVDYLIAQCLSHCGRTDDALGALRKFLETQGGSGLEQVPAARAMVGDVLLRQQKREQAIEAWSAYLRQHPAHRDWERVQRAIVDAEFGMAHAAQQEGKEQFDRARELYLAFARKYPLDARNPDILLRLGDMEKVEQDFAGARVAYARCVAKYPGRDESSRAQFEIGRIFEQKEKNFDAALKAYKEVKGSWQAQARGAIQRLTQKRLELRTDRVFRTDEPAVFEVLSRNIDKVRVRVYRLQLEDYFRATHTVGDIRRLDIEIIAPDKTFDSKVEDYQRLAETRRDVAIGFAEPGAYVVKVDDQELEATTMVLVSDLALIGKSNRHEFLVFTQNTKEQRPQGGVKVVLSDGKKVVAEGETDDKGIYRFRGEELQQRDRLVVFAVDASGSGASSLPLSGLGYSPGLSPKGYLYTDRPLYRPGQRVHLKGIVREVEAGLYRLPKGSDYRITVTRPGGQPVLDAPVAFTPFGTFAMDVTLPEDADLGAWAIAVQDPERPECSFHGRFTVGQYERPRLSLDLELDETVVFRGEKITGRAVAKHFYGEPAVGKDLVLTMQLPDGAHLRQEGRTNAAGEVEFDFGTKEFSEEAFAFVIANLEGENVQAETVVPIVTTELTAAVETVRPIYLTEEPFEARVTVVDRSGKPLQRDATVVLTRLERTSRGEVAEVEVARRKMKTDADGLGRCAFTASEGGDHRLRVEVEDRFGTLVTGYAGLGISGENDAQKIRLLCDRDTFRTGETAAVKVMNRAGTKLALLTWQGDGILACEPRMLPAGESMLQLPIETKHAPNFAIAVAMIDGKKLHEAQRDFLVERDLNLELKIPKSAAPGAEVEVEITARDAEGRPVATELSLALVDEALLAVAGSGAAPIGSFFHGERRETVFRTASSCTWGYRGRSERINDALIAEERREALQLFRSAEAANESLSEIAQTLRGEAWSQMEEGTAQQPGTDAAVMDQLGSLLAHQGQLRAQTLTRNRGYFGDNGVQTSSGQTQVHYAARPVQQQGMVTDINLNGFGVDTRGLGGMRVRRFANNSEGLQLDSANKESAFDSSQWNTAVGLGFYAMGGGGGGGAWGRDDGRTTGMPRTDFRETGAWIATVVTDADGRAKTKITLPHSTTAWQLLGRGVTLATEVGETTAKIATKKDLQVAVAAPATLVEGDVTEVSMSVHNLTDADTAADLSWEISGAATQKMDASRPLAAHQQVEFGVRVEAGKAAPLAIALTGSAGERRDELRTTVPVLPFGVELLDGASGSTKDRAGLLLGLPGGREYANLRLVLEVGPDPGRDLIAAALGRGFQPQNSRQVHVTNLAQASRGLAVLRALAHVERTGGGEVVELGQLRREAERLVAALIGRQSKQGGFAWVGRRHDDLRSTCQVVRFLAFARSRGLTGTDKALDRGVEWLLQQLRSAPAESRTDIVWALASCGKARFESLNSLQRARQSLGVDGLGRLALAFFEFGRPEAAGDVLAVLRTKLDPKALRSSSVETIALATAALLRGDRRDRLGTAGLQYLAQNRVGAGWNTPEATAAAIAAIGLAERTGAGAPRATKVTVTCNGQALEAEEAVEGALTRRYVVPAGLVTAQGNKLAIAVEGGGEVYYRAWLLGFGKGFLPADRNDSRVWITRRYLAAARRHEGKVVPSGFSCVTGKDYPHFHNEISRLRIGESCRVETYWSLRRESDQKVVTPMVVEEPIPAGCSVPRGSVKGSFDHFELQPDRLVFYFREGITGATVSYELQARFPGTYRVPPTRVQSALRADFQAYGDPGRMLVDARDSQEKDAYRLTPDELLWLGTACFDAAEKASGKQRTALQATAWEHLTMLLDGWQKQEHQLREDRFKEVARMMLFLGIDRGDARAVVRFFEQLKDRYADLVIPFDRIVAVGKSYLDLGEFEAALLVFRATAESSFLKDAAVSSVLEQHGEFRAANGFLANLLVSYPDLATMRLSRYGIGQKMAAKAASLSPEAPVDERVGSTDELRAGAIAVLREFLVLHPDDPMADEVSFAWATTHAEGKNLKSALAVSEAARQRYPKSAFTDEFLYAEGYAHFVLGRHDAAFAALHRVATESFPRPSGGGRGESESRWHAVYLQGQIHHARGDREKALEAYDEVAERFGDATEAADYFRQRRLTLPEVTTVRLAEPAEVAISYRNVERVAVQVFKVDLMRLYVMERSLQDIRGVQLHGIRPQLSFEVELGEGRDYRGKEKKVPLDLAEPGAYLVVLRSGDRLTSGMVLRSDLEIEAQEQFDAGRLRVNCKQGDAFLADAHVKIGSAGRQAIEGGDTDLRGLFVGENLIGPATVIVQKGEQYAFYRGKQPHQPIAYAPQLKQLEQQRAAVRPVDQSKGKGQRFEAFENNFNMNASNRARQVDWLKKNVLDNKQKGVEVYRTK